MIDLGNGQTEGRQVLLLLQRFLQLHLHRGEIAAGHRQLVAAAVTDIDMGRVFGIGGELLHAAGQPANRADEEAVDRKKDQRRGEQRDQHR